MDPINQLNCTAYLNEQLTVLSCENGYLASVPTTAFLQGASHVPTKQEKRNNAVRDIRLGNYLTITNDDGSAITAWNMDLTQSISMKLQDAMG